jgi:hypothetical protein
MRNSRFKVEIIVVVVFVLAPDADSLPCFCRAACQGLKERHPGYGLLASRYVNEFDSKWRQGNVAQTNSYRQRDIQITG